MGFLYICMQMSVEYCKQTDYCFLANPFPIRVFSHDRVILLYVVFDTYVINNVRTHR